MYDFRHLNDFRQLSGQLLHSVRLDGYDMHRFEKKLLYATSFGAIVFKKQFWKYLLDLLKVSTISLKNAL